MRRIWKEIIAAALLCAAFSTPARADQGLGSGVIIDPSGLILTRSVLVLLRRGRAAYHITLPF